MVGLMARKKVIKRRPTSGNGRGWHGEARRHSEAATRGRASPKYQPPYTATKLENRREAEKILHRVRNKHIPPEVFMDLTGELHTFAEQFPDDSDEYIVLRELEWIFVQLHDDPPRLLKEKWGFKPKKER